MKTSVQCTFPRWDHVLVWSVSPHYMIICRWQIVRITELRIIMLLDRVRPKRTKYLLKVLQKSSSSETFFPWNIGSIPQADLKRSGAAKKMQWSWPTDVLLQRVRQAPKQGPKFDLIKHWTSWCQIKPILSKTGTSYRAPNGFTTNSLLQWPSRSPLYANFVHTIVKLIVQILKVPLVTYFE